MTPAEAAHAADRRVVEEAAAPEAGRGTPRDARPRARACPHCGTLVEGARETFCCGGCEVAYEIIRGAGLERYYELRTELPPRPEPWRERWDSVVPDARSDGSCEIRLAVDGLRCASCVWVAEKVLERTPGVESAMVSYATGRASVRWDPERTGLAEIAGRIAALGYRPRVLGEEASPDRDLLTRLGVAAFAASNVMMFSAALYAGWLGPMEPAFVELFRWLTLALATPVALWSAAPFFAAAWSGLRNRVLHMDVPIALAITILYGQGVVGTLRGFDTYLDSLTMLVTLLLAGRVLESRGRRRAAEAAVTLAATVPATARRVRGDTVETVASSELRPGDLVSVGAGEDVPADGTVVSGEGSLQLALLTGESEPVRLRDGDEVWAGTLLQDGAITLEVAVPSESTVIQKMADELRRAADRSVRPTSTDRIAPWFTAATLVVAGLTFLAWIPIGGPARALTTTIAVLIVACPCALALSRPLTAAAGLGAAARRGLLFRSPDALLAAARVDLVVLDKTGTVTEGSAEITRASDHDLRVAAGLERFSRHPVGVAIVREAVRRGLPLPEATSVRETVGRGIEGVVDGRRWAIRSGGSGISLLESDDGYVGVLRHGDRLREDSAGASSALRELGVDLHLLSGDTVESTRRIAAAIGGVAFDAGQRPAEKARRIESWRGAGRTVLFVGDGLNDGPGLAAADVGVAMGSGAASSIMTADAVLGRGSLLPIGAGLRVARIARGAVRASQLRSIVYNVAAVGAAAAGLVNPLVAAVLMPLSSAMVVVGALGVERRAARHDPFHGGGSHPVVGSR